MKVKELIEQLSKLDPELECYTLDSRSEWNCISQVWSEPDMTIDHKAIAYFESTWAMSKFVPYEVWSAQDELQPKGLADKARIGV